MKGVPDKLARRSPMVQSKQVVTDLIDREQLVRRKAWLMREETRPLMWRAVPPTWLVEPTIKASGMSAKQANGILKPSATMNEPPRRLGRLPSCRSWPSEPLV